MNASAPLSLYQGFGIELEYIVVDSGSFDIAPVVDAILRKAAGRDTNDYETGETGWCNELVSHVIEVQNIEPVLDLSRLLAGLRTSVNEINRLAAELGCRLMPGAMHPWMDPRRETVIWKGEYNEVYHAFDRLFDCHRHGWANLQSCQINLPFSNDEEFARLHAAIRFLLPLMPAIASSSPFFEGVHNGRLSNRLAVYRHNADRVPEIVGRCIPETVKSREHYEQTILTPIYEALQPLDPEGLLAHEWVNARGAIARFDRSAVEIRVLDIQECPEADLAVCEAIVHVLHALTDGRFLTAEKMMAWPLEKLETVFLAAVESGEQAWIEDPAYLEAFGLRGSRLRAGELWHHLLEQVFPLERKTQLTVLQTILNEGVLARRMVRAAGDKPDRKTLTRLCKELCACLEEGHLFRGF